MRHAMAGNFACKRRFEDPSVGGRRASPTRRTQPRTDTGSDDGNVTLREYHYLLAAHHPLPGHGNNQASPPQIGVCMPLVPAVLSRNSYVTRTDSRDLPGLPSIFRRQTKHTHTHTK